MRERTAQIGFNAVMLVLACVCMVYGNTFIYPTKAYMLGIFGLIAASCLANLFVILRAGRCSPASEAGAGEKKPFLGTKEARAIALVLAYAGGIPVIGFYTMSLAYFVASVVLFSVRGKGEWRRAALVAVIMVGIVYLLFSYFLRVPAPQGLFI